MFPYYGTIEIFEVENRFSDDAACRYVLIQDGGANDGWGGVQRVEHHQERPIKHPLHQTVKLQFGKW